MKRYRMIRWILWICCLCCEAGVYAQDADSTTWKPEWGGELTSELQLTHKGKCNFTNLLRLHASLPVCRSLSFDVASLSTYMTRKESIGDDLQTFSNLDAENIPFALTVCGLNWDVAASPKRQADDSHTLFLGVRNMNEDYFCSPVTSFFTNSSCGIYPTLSANYPVANYPLASVGAHYRYEHRWGDDEDDEDYEDENDYDYDDDGHGDDEIDEEDGELDAIVLQASVYNGMGHRRFTGRENVFRFCPKGDGVFGLTELQYQHRGSRYFLGTALYYNKAAEGLGTNQMNFTPWFYAEQRVTPRLHLLLGCSHAFVKEEEGDADLLCRDFAGVGAHYQLRKVALGIFTDYARFGKTNEWATEVSCQWTVNRYLSIQPTAHFIKTDSQYTTAFALRLQVEI